LCCEFCQNKHKRKLIEILKQSIADDLDIYDYPKYIAKLKKQEEEERKRNYQETSRRFCK
jgi:hypothetical protein